jgi:hypothetical protein
MTVKSKSQREQSQRCIDTAKSLGLDNAEAEAEFHRALGKIVPRVKPRADALSAKPKKVRLRKPS